jgi:RNA polymerase sigma factor (sigma-70 family)
MGESVRTVIRSRGTTLRPGDVVALNNPYNGGTHLPDVTVITPVFDEAGSDILFFVGSRGVRANVVAPGYVQTRLTEAIPEELQQGMLKATPLARFGTPEDIIAGVNDVYQGRSADSVTAQLRAMYDRAKAAHIPVIAGSIVPYNTATPEQNARMRSEGLSTALRSLDPRSRRIIEARWLTDNASVTLHDLAAEFGVSAERIRQIENKALDKMKSLIAA